MVVILLIIIVCVLLFGADKTKAGISNIIVYGLVLFLVLGLLGSCMR